MNCDELLFYVNVESQSRKFIWLSRRGFSLSVCKYR